MLSIFKKKNNGRVDLSALGADMHSHLLPGIDDGSPDCDTSMELIDGLEQLGFNRFITTPHILWDLYKNDTASITSAHNELQQALRAAGRSVSIRAAAEYYLDEHVDELLEKQEPLRTIKDNWVLIEFSFVAPPFDLSEKLFNLQIKGYKPVLAHPERYAYFSAKKNVYDELKEQGCYFQLNLLSLAGYYGKIPQELANYLVKKKYVDLLGTDLHHSRHLHALRSSFSVMDQIQALLDSGKILNSSL